MAIAKSTKRGAALKKYREKRNFRQTPEPGGKKARQAGNSFVVQEHHARSHHFDFRLEIDGVLVSWAVPKGIPEELSSKRLAVHVEDHPLEYGGFEGTIPEGNYGAGNVAIWDKGTWEPLEKNWRKDFAKGKMKFALHGQRLSGPYLLARMSEEPNWLLRKLDPATHPEALEAEPESEVAAFVPPQLARPVTTVPEGKEWLHELKYDGYRLIAVRKKGEVRLFTRNQLDWTARFAELAKRLEALKGGDFVLDGEAVVFDSKGRSSFGALQEALKSGKGIDFVAFDLLHLDGRNLRGLTLSKRLEHLAKLVPKETGPVRRSKTWPSGEGVELFQQSCKLGLEGIISKRSHGTYQPESRRDWTKSKCRPRQEFIICGFTEPKGSCPAFGALLLGSVENGRMVPRGKVGTGFTDQSRHRLLKQMKPLATSRAPFPASERGVTWVEPRLVAEVDFAELTRDGAIRQGSFVSLREDKPASEVHVDPVEATGGRGSVVAGVEISNSDRVVYPDDGVTKLEVARYYERVGELMLPHVADRPLALLRTPEGIAGEKFFQKSFKSHVPEHVKVKTLDDGTEILFIHDVAGLISLAQFGVIELHPWGSRLPLVDKPDVLVWDLDPDEKVPWKETLGAAFLLRDCLADYGLETRVKSSGGKGIHVVMHIKRQHGWDFMKPFTKAVAAKVAEKNPQRFIITSSKSKRSGKIYIDWLRNGRGATCIAPWALRARPGAPISMPVEWDELAEMGPRGFTIREPVKEPASWKSIEPQHLPVSLVREISGGS
ncbi:DNA ligase D [Luteolibacter arcticus]|uniref:DNA ligase (ATP) n=1 Tax=Luteolibacter arcticus TaxID=1581411 RepID=A0ABT3GHV0_9BACT|nr:DNA ligase D [Luteolibacter arcticus]MCW1923087.1 DNA ligase D [Luteolibacter arcticus]